MQKKKFVKSKEKRNWQIRMIYILNARPKGWKKFFFLFFQSFFCLQGEYCEEEEEKKYKNKIQPLQDINHFQLI